MERTMKIQEVLLRAMARKITWFQAAEILGFSDRHLRRIRERYEEFGYDGLFDRRREQALTQTRSLGRGGGGAGTLSREVFRSERPPFSREAEGRTPNRFELQLGSKPRCRERGWWRGPGNAECTADGGSGRPLPGMLLHIDGSRHQWFQDERWYDLIVILDDATSEIYYAQLVEEESTLTVTARLQEVIEGKGVFCALYSDRGTHFWLTPKAGSKVDPHRLTQVGRALRELGIQMIPAYSPQARGRRERNFGTWQGRLPQELRLHGIATLEAANRFLREHYIAAFNRRFQVPAQERGSAFMRRSSKDLDLIFALQYQRTVNRDNTVNIQNLPLQIEPVRWRATLAGCTVTVHQHLDGTFTLTHGPQRLGHYSAEGVSLEKAKIGRRGAVEKTRGGKVQKPTFRFAWKPRKQRGISTFPQPRRRLGINHNRTFHLLLKPDILICSQHSRQVGCWIRSPPTPAIRSDRSSS
jgi:hypothetical protein